MAVFNYHKKASLQNRLDKLAAKKPAKAEYIAVFGDPEQDQEYREEMGLPPVDYNGPYVAEWRENNEKEVLRIPGKSK